MRLGQGLDSDFGPSLLGNGQNGTDAYTPTQPLVWYVFAGADGRVVAHDIFIQGNDFQKSRSTSLIPLQGDAEIGAAVMLYGLRISATEVFRNPAVPPLSTRIPIRLDRDFGAVLGFSAGAGRSAPALASGG